MNPFDEIRQAVRSAREVNNAVDSQANALVDLVEGRLQHVDAYRLRKLKKELARFNATTGKWNSR